MAGSRAKGGDSTPTSPSADLARLAAHHQVATDYWDWRGRHVVVPAATLEAVLAALGVPCGTPDEIASSLERAELAAWRRVLPVCLVVREAAATRFAVHVPHGSTVGVRVDLEASGGSRELTAADHWVDPLVVDGRLIGEATFAVPTDLPLGYHELVARVGDAEHRAPLIVVPNRLDPLPAAATHQTWGYLAQLYSVRSRRSWGIGDLSDLADLAAYAGRRLGAGFVLVNPLHAGEVTPPLSDSPYLPASRRFVNPLYVRVEAIPEAAYADAASRRRIGHLQRRAWPPGSADRPDGLLDRDRAWSAKLDALRLVHAVPRSIGRDAAYADFRAREGDGLAAFATWCAIATRHGSDTSTWPDALRDPASPEVAAAAEELVDEVELFAWLQWVAEEQLAAAQSVATEAGMPVGIVHDLAVGVHPCGADAWALRSVLARGVTVGAPPDEFNQLGQDWSQPPWDPRALAAAGYGPWREMLRSVMRHAGGLRVDHVLGLFRLWWIPAGGPAAAGTYVRLDHEALVGILVLEAHRAGVLVVGEDLGNVEPWVRDHLADRGILGTSLLWFERDDAGQPKPPEQWRELALATVATHDLPPTAAYLTGDHVELRGRLGLLTRPIEEERAEAAAALEDWRRLLTDLDLLRPGVGAAETVEALHRFLARTPSRLVGVQLVDAVGDRRTQNQPGTFREYPNWRIPLSGPHGEPVLLEDLPHLLRRPW